MTNIELCSSAKRSANSTHVYHRMLDRGFLVGHVEIDVTIVWYYRERIV